MVARITINGTKTSWYHKWSIHRRLRPEEYGGRVHNHKTGAAGYPLHQQVLTRRRAAHVFGKSGTYLLPHGVSRGLSDPPGLSGRRTPSLPARA